MRALRRLSLATAGIAASIALVGCSPLQGDIYIVGADAPEPGTPYCMVDREIPGHLTVAGPAGGWITVDGDGYKALTRIAGDYADEVQPDAGPFDGILYNVPGDQIAVDGHLCETT